MAEFLVHELTHNLLFIDERVHGHYRNHEDLADDRNYAHSSVLQKRRPLDKAFHSLVVAHELLKFRESHPIIATPSLHPSSEMLLKSALHTIQEIEVISGQTDIALPRLKQFLSKISKNLKNIEH